MSGCGSNSTEPKDGGGTSDARIDSSRDAGPGASDAATDSSRWDAVDSGSQEAATNDTSQDAGGGASDARIDSFGDAGSGASDAATDSSRWDAVDSGSQEAATNDTSQNAAPDSWSNGSEGGTLDSPTDAYASRGPFRIINYYPSGYAWYAMWDNFGAAQSAIEADMQVIEELGATEVRIFIPPSRFGWSAIVADAGADIGTGEAGVEDAGAAASDHEADLSSFLDILGRHHLRAVPTLFDLDTHFDDVESSRAWMRTLMAHWKNDPRIAMWELKNEIDFTKAVQKKWTLALFDDFKAAAGQIPVTISVAAIRDDAGVELWRAGFEDLVSSLGTRPDYYAFHWFPAGEITWTALLKDDLHAVVEAVADPKRIVLGELGQSTGSFWSEAAQANAIAAIVQEARGVGIEHFGIWTLRDFVDGTVIGNQPASVNELNFGIYRVAPGYGAKAAEAVVKGVFSGSNGSINVPSPYANLSFEDVDYRTGELEAWRPWAYDTALGTTVAGNLARDLSRHHGNGTAAVRIDMNTPEITYGIYLTPTMPVDSTKSYKVSAYAQLPDPSSSASLVLSWQEVYETGAVQWRGQNEGAPVSGGSTDWVSLTVTGTAPDHTADAGTTYLRAQVFVHVRSTSTGASAYIDDVQLP
jgi:hypothetical protein